MPRSQHIALISVFGVLVFISKMVLPTPFDKMIVIVQALLLALGSLILDKVGATSVACIGGLLTTLWRPMYAPFSLLFALIYGLLVDLSFKIFKVKKPDGVRTIRAVISLALSTALIGLPSSILMVEWEVMPRIPGLYAFIVIIGIVNGALAGYFSSSIWNKYFHNLQYQDFKSTS